MRSAKLPQHPSASSAAAKKADRRDAEKAESSAPPKKTATPKPALAAASARKQASDMFTRLVKNTPEAGYQAIHTIRDGFPATIMKEASGFFGVPEGRIFSVAGVAPTSAYRLLQKGAKIDSAATERVYRMSSITHMAIDVFESKETAIAWMAEPNRALGDAAPLDLMDTEPGAAAVRLVLNAIATGGVA